jgi:surface antigen
MKLTSILALLQAAVTTTLALPVVESQTFEPSISKRSGDDYPYKAQCALKAPNNIDRWHFYKCECVSFVAWRINQVLDINFTNMYKGQHWGNANLWDEAARKSTGVKIDKKPKKNSVAQTDKSGSGLGHVAWVKSVSEDGKKVTVEEYNYKKDKYGTRTVGVGEFEWYIHLK